MDFKIPAIGERAIDGAAMYLCILAYSDDELKRRETFEACAAHRVRSYREHYRHVGIDEAFADRTRPLLECWPMRDMWNCLSGLDKQLRNRLKAAELLGYFAVSQFVKPPRRVAGICPQRLVSEQVMTLKPDGSLAAVDTLRSEPDFPTPELEAVEENGVRRLQLIDPSCVRPATYSDLLRVGAKRWHVTEHSVGAVILTPVRFVPHMALALRETLLRRSPAAADILDLLACPQWVLPCVEHSRSIAGSWADNANLYPAWKKFDRESFVELQASV